jgi:GNAT superfamily N-acetyltransferase
MKNLLTEWRKYLSEEAKEISDLALYLDDGFIILYDYNGVLANIRKSVYEDPDEYDIQKYIVGVVRLGFREGHMTIEEIWAKKGYGPALYRLAIEQSGRAGITPSRLRGEVSTAASNVWKQFYDGKGAQHVRHEPLENKVHDTEWLDSAYYSEGEKIKKEKALSRHNKIFNSSRDPYEELFTHFLESADSKLGLEMSEIGYG